MGIAYPVIVVALAIAVTIPAQPSHVAVRTTIIAMKMRIVAQSIAAMAFARIIVTVGQQGVSAPSISNAARGIAPITHVRLIWAAQTMCLLRCLYLAQLVYGEKSHSQPR